MLLGANTKTGDTLTTENNPIMLEAISFAEPVIGLVIEPKTKGDRDKLGIALNKFMEEDPTFKVKSDPETGEMVERKIGHYFLNEARDKIGLPHKGDEFAMIGWVYDEAPDHIGDNYVSFGIDQIIQNPEFLHGPMRDIPLDFNVDGVITHLI